MSRGGAPSQRTRRRAAVKRSVLPKMEANRQLNVLRTELWKAQGEMREWRRRARKAELELSRGEEE